MVWRGPHNMRNFIKASQPYEGEKLWPGAMEVLRSRAYEIQASVSSDYT